MAYKVFFVEDEIITREGIRDNVDGQASGFEFCGEATDGEMALPLLRTAQPDVLITDIKMPFMDGLQLSKIVRERMPWVKIIILSGHDEFEYVQKSHWSGDYGLSVKACHCSEVANGPAKTDPVWGSDQRYHRVHELVVDSHWCGCAYPDLYRDPKPVLHEKKAQLRIGGRIQLEAALEFPYSGSSLRCD